MSDLDLTALEMAGRLESGKADPRVLVRECLDRAERNDADHSIFVRLTRARALAEADQAADRMRAGTRRSKLDGLPIAWKDNIDVLGAASEGGSKLLKGRTPARDAPLVAKLAQAGLCSFAKTNMTELAFSGLGYNPYTGTPRNACDDRVARLPGGSSSGAGVAVARHLSPVAIGTDTGGSVRIPASWNGLVGLKTTAGRHGTEGLVLLSPSLDTIGPLTRNVADAAALFELMFDEKEIRLTDRTPADLHLLALEGSVLGRLDEATQKAFAAALDRIAKAGAKIEGRTLRSVEETAQTPNPVGYEAYQLWGRQIEGRPGVVWDLVAERVLAGKAVTEESYRAVLSKLAALSKQFAEEVRGFDAVLMPTVAMTAPAIAEVEASTDAYHAINLKALSLPRLANLMGLCAVTVPIERGTQPIGLTVLGRPYEEASILQIAAALERILAS